MVIWITGISGAGKTTLGSYFFKNLKKKKFNSIFLDGDETRKIFFGHGKYSLNDRDLHAIKLTNLVKYLSDQNINIIISANITSQKYRNWCKKNIKNYFEVFIDVPMDILKERDVKKLYINALKGKIKNVVGVDIPFIKPNSPNLIVDNSKSFNRISIIVEEIIDKSKIFNN